MRITKHCRNLGGQLYSQHYLATNHLSSVDRLLICFAVIRKFRSFNQQHHRADTATNSQTAAMPDVVGNFERGISTFIYYYRTFR